MELFGYAIDGNVYQPPSGPSIPSITSLNIPFYGNATRLLTKIPSGYVTGLNKINHAIAIGQQIAQIPTAVNGALGSFGSFNFGNSSNTNAVSDSIISSDSARGISVSGDTSGINTQYIPQPSIPADNYDAAFNIAQLSGSSSAGMTASLLYPGSDILGNLNNARGDSSQVGFRTSPDPSFDPNDFV
jgi:hypothetical protein